MNTFEILSHFILLSAICLDIIEGACPANMRESGTPENRYNAEGKVIFTGCSQDFDAGEARLLNGLCCERDPAVCVDWAADCQEKIAKGYMSCKPTKKEFPYNWYTMKANVQRNCRKTCGFCKTTTCVVSTNEVHYDGAVCRCR